MEVYALMGICFVLMTFEVAWLVLSLCVHGLAAIFTKSTLPKKMFE